GLFLFEFIEGNTVTRIQFRKTLHRSREALARGDTLTDELRGDARSMINQIAHFLDVPLFTVIVYCGVIRPSSWNHVLSAIGVGVFVATVLIIVVPKVARQNTGNS
ncbi:MAG: hypothetical protein ACKVHL_10695, partial [Rhodospirillales bacterium]